VPKTISFGFGVPKVFPMMHGKKSAAAGESGKPHWHQVPIRFTTSLSVKKFRGIVSFCIFGQKFVQKNSKLN
jgi:hypothetical protein